MKIEGNIKVEIDYKTRDAATCRVTVAAKDLQEAPIEQIVELLKASAAPNDKWLEVAFAYLKLDQVEGFKRVLHGCIDLNKKKGMNGRKTIVHLYNILTGYFMGKYLAEGNSVEKEKLRSQFLSEINTSDEYTRDIPMIIVKKGFVTLAENNLKYAKMHFDYAVEKDSKQVLSLFGKACLAYNQQSYSEALKLFQHIFKLNPEVGINIRQCIGLCFYRLEDYKRANRTFTRCLELDPNNDFCLTYLGIIALREPNANIQSALNLFERAYKINPNNPLCLTQLANHYFLVGDFAKTEILTKNALDVLNCYKIVKSAQISTQANSNSISLGIDGMRADLHFLLGKVAHCKEMYGRALKLYKECLDEDSQHYAASFCLAQVHVQMNQFVEAEKLLLKLREINQFRADPEIGRLLGFCQVKLGKTKEAIKQYEEVVKFLPDDIETLIKIAELLEIEDPSKALSYYTQAINLLKKTDAELLKTEIELLNNVGVVHIFVGNLVEAGKYLRKALSKLHEEQKNGKSIRVSALETALQFNLGYLYEMKGLFAEASLSYKKIAKINPNYVDAYMRLAILAMNRGDYARAVHYGKVAKQQLKEKNSRVCDCFLGTIYAQMGETRQASDIFHYTFEATGRQEVYALIGAASMSLIRAQRGEKIDTESAKRALIRFSLALESDEKNAYATIGIGNCLALLGKHDEAIQIYKLINETFNNTQMAMINLARIYMLNGRKTDAIPIYKKYIEKYAKKGEMIELELAAAYCQDGTHEEALAVLKKLQNRFPSNLIIKYNIAICLKQQVKALFRAKIRKVTQTQDAIRRIKIAISFFEEVKETKTDLIFTGQPTQTEEKQEMLRMIDIIIKRTDNQLLYCKDILASSDDYLDNDLRVEQELNQQKKEQERILRERSLAEKAVVSKRTVTQQEEEEMARRIAMLTENLKTERIGKNAKKKGKKKKEEEEKEEDEFDEEINNIVMEKEEKEFDFEHEKMDDLDDNVAGYNPLKAEEPQETKVKKRRLHKAEEDDD